jgi:Ni,Fe-hydrogenase III component G
LVIGDCRSQMIGRFMAMPLLHNVPPRQIAKLIRGLDSALAGIEYDASGAAPVLVYSFEVAGRRERFAVPAQPDALVSIADLYPAAAAHERRLQRQYGLIFRRPADQPDD